MPACTFCGKHVPTTSGLKRHIQRTKDCHQQWLAKLKTFTIADYGNNGDSDNESVYEDDLPDEQASSSHSTTGLDQLGSPLLPVPPNSTIASSADGLHPPEPEAEDSEPVTGRERFVEGFPGIAGQGLRREETRFDKLRRTQEERRQAVWDPFVDEEEWELARWLAKNVGQNQIDEFLKLSITRNRTKPSYKNKQSLNDKIDALPATGAPWVQEIITIAGDQFGEDGRLMEEEVELWYQDPVECIHELMGNPAFSGKQAYAPERVYADAAGRNRMYDEMWTGDWWWDVQSKLPPGATVAPVILASDKTQLSRHRGDKEAWPVYLTIGNIEKATRRLPSSHAMILIGYLPVAELACISEKARSAVGYKLYHFCMRRILESLVKAGSEGVEMVCADRWVRLVFPILAAYVADHPERCLIACCKQNRCPQCLVDATELGELLDGLRYRDAQRTKKILEHKATGRRVRAYLEEGLRPVDKPCWTDLPHTDIHRCFMPDLLHQVHKGIIKDHLVQWCIRIAGKEEVDARFSRMTDHPDIRHFTHGISGISQWTGTESRELKKVLIGVVNGAVQPAVAKAAQALLDFSYYAQFHTHTDETLDLLQAALREFHEYKDIFLQSGTRDDFNFPKMHAILHYIDSIRSRGSADGYSTELPERLHINFAKAAYRATNKRENSAFTTYLDWRRAEAASEQVVPADNADSNSDDEDDTQPASGQQPSGRLILPRKPTFPQMKSSEIIEDLKATQFLPALTEYLQKTGPSNHPILAPTVADRFDVYKQVKIRRPDLLVLEPNQASDRIRASPASKGRPGRSGTPSRADTALVLANEASNVSDLTALRVAQVRVIFALPSHLRVCPR
ncbi:hypothetical protein GLOTRDRAFT_129596 [Gloeophyllum trabeum ATCC 11539]|uniref:C2H2-type domain-containing protein n=1 Tax=Gloeophyllum trabeum (strain ATCC 11539 / FP-39264 / Madison 617) TaxID=670483 RepID=S7RQX1_GLOTA|nr:uncharacterized protein GLOTRDRAFT_129596 [Gloeophyllum trabeum ATCC 11539]EPQ55314.1 hypothetical protein GLOTRDRAFT_129596 [Gloeophyllum trabeum ATCC 11539]